MSALRTTLGLLLAAYLALAVWRVVRFPKPPPSWFPEPIWRVTDPLMTLSERWPWVALGVAVAMALLALVLLMSRADWDRILTGAGGSAYALYIVNAVMLVISWAWRADGGLSGPIAWAVSWVGIPPVAPEAWPLWVVVVVATIAGLLVVVLPVAIVVAVAISIRATVQTLRRRPEGLDQSSTDQLPAQYWRGRRIQ